MKLVYERVQYEYETQEEKHEHEQQMFANGWKLDTYNFGLLHQSYFRKI